VSVRFGLVERCEENNPIRFLQSKYAVLYIRSAIIALTVSFATQLH
jgi:hypothetical protein